MSKDARALEVSRRGLLIAGVASVVPVWMTGCSTTTRRRLDGRSPTSHAHDGPERTHEETEGPYYRLLSPQKSSLIEDGVTGVHLALAGRVVTTDGQPVPNALLDFWQADEHGEYDFKGYRLRGHQFTDTSGAYRLETIVPGLYGGRTRHIHVKIQPPGERVGKDPDELVLTTQLYFPGEPRNERDDLFDRDLLMQVDDIGDGRRASFDFVLDLA